jgi:ABC-2 type transport system permease protein
MTAGLRDTLVIARREFLERVRTKWFLAMTLLGPVFMIALIVIPAVIATKGGKGARIEIVDKTGQLAAPLIKLVSVFQWTATEVPSTTTDAVEQARVDADQINGWLAIPANAMDGGLIVYRGDNSSNQMFKAQLTGALNQTVYERRAAKFHIDESQVKGILEKVNFDAQQPSGGSGTGAYIIAYILAFILYMVITLYGVAVMRSVVQEKTSRVMEFLVAAVKPSALMGGKIVGVGGAALVQIVVWLGIGALALAYREQVLGLFGITGAGSAELPPLAGVEFTVILLFFILGYFFYSSMYAAVGAMVSSEQDTQQVQMPVTMLLVIGVMCLNLVSNAPRGSTTAIMTMIPLWSPILMPMRFVLGGATIGEVGISLGLLLVSTVLVTRAAAKIYRVGVLLYGKRPSIRELIRWLRY